MKFHNPCGLPSAVFGPQTSSIRIPGECKVSGLPPDLWHRKRPGVLPGAQA